MTIVVLAHPNDAAAARLVQRWRAQGALLMVPRDLSRAGWRMYVGGRGEEWFVAEDEPHRTAALRGVLTRLPGLEPGALPHLHPGDRDYVATEMTAFLIAWLSKLKCPVLNRPTASSMLGPNLACDRLPALAARSAIRMPMRATGVDGHGLLPFAAATVSVVGDRWFGDVPQALGVQALRLARTAGARLLTVQFDGVGEPAEGAGERDGASLVGAELLVDVDRPDIADAVLALFGEAQECR